MRTADFRCNLYWREGFNMTEPKPTDASETRAAAIHAEIDKLTGGNKTALEDQGSGKTSEKSPPPSPRDYIQQWMADHDKKPGEK
jgi:hypothetical protein